MPIPATIVEISQASPTTKALRLDTGGNRLSFRPGQWVDFYADIGGEIAVAGYSITSSPSRTGGLELAVKLVGENPVTYYVHQRARVGDVVEVEVGGDFLYTSDMGGPLVLVAGGIGITPLMSIVRYVERVGAAGAPYAALQREDARRVAVQRGAGRHRSRQPRYRLPLQRHAAHRSRLDRSSGQNRPRHGRGGGRRRGVPLSSYAARRR